MKLKKVLLMITIMMISISSFSQNTKSLHRKYESYYKYLAFRKITPLSYQTWLTNTCRVDKSTLSYNYPLPKPLLAVKK